jgi:ABC-type uncharacterized transport system ATPase subunit
MHSASRANIAPFISLSHISKRFGPLWANHDISLDFNQGETHAIVGENGAGKSTLMKILNGHLQPDAGEIRLRGSGVAFPHPQDAMRAGIGMAYQQMLIFPQLTALENVIVGSEPGAGGWIKRTQAQVELLELCQSVGFDLPLDGLASELSFAHRQQIEILRLLYRKVKTLILDEPTSLLAPPEAERFLDLLKSLQARGHTILFVTHRLQEVFAIADRISVLSRGKFVGSYPKSEITAEQLVQLIMSGGQSGTPSAAESGDRASESLDHRRDTYDSNSTPGSREHGPQRFNAHTRPPGLGTQRSSQPPNSKPKIRNQKFETARTSRHHVPSETASPFLELREITTRPGPHEAGLDGVSFTIYQGEVFGLGGVVGNGQRTLALLLSGILPAERGAVFLSSEEITYRPISRRTEMGLRWLPANPVEEVLLPSRSLWENLLLGQQRKGAFQHYGWLEQKAINNWAKKQLLHNEVVHATLTDSVSSLSGGNLQKLALPACWKAIRGWLFWNNQRAAWTSGLRSDCGTRCAN